MPNICSFTLRAVGTKEAIKTLRTYLENDYSYTTVSPKEKPELLKRFKMVFEEEQDGKKNYLYTNAEKHFYRVFELWPGYNEKTHEYEDEPEEVDDGEYAQVFFGICAWSVADCLTREGYYADSVDKIPMARAHATSLEDITTELPLKVEVFSTEPSQAFAEHYLYENGQATIQDVHSYYEFYKGDYETKQDAEKEFETTISDEKWEGDGYIQICDVDPYNPEWTI